MRYVDVRSLSLPEGWLERSRAASRAVANGADPNEHRSVWAELKDGLAELLHNKCWYCEVPVERSDNAVDHFRPKGRVCDADRAHSGYRWLAFQHLNFRYSCTFCNSRRKDVLFGTSGGKGDRFPLLDESKRVYFSGAIEEEEPVLLDPCVVDDCQLLGCRREDGHPCPAIADPVGGRRARESIKIYHLHHESTCKRRHTSAVQLLADLEDGKRQFTLASRDGTRKGDFDRVAKRLYRSISRDAAFSGEMRFLMRGERSAEHPWIQGILEA